MEKILVVEDTDPLREVICTVLEREGFSVIGVSKGEDVLPVLKESEFSCILADFKLPGINGTQLLQGVREHYPSLPFVLMTAFGSIEIAVEAMKYGANDFICKPFEPDHLANMLREVIRHRRIITRDSTGRSAARKEIRTESPKVQKILAQARQVAKVNTSVLILGESGTGKELLARFIHDNSPNSEKPFVAVNCAALPADLLESEFFGHEVGAFTGATQSRAGVLEVASDGTIFLDEIGDMPPVLQVKLLRALQEREVRRLGSNKHIPINPRVIAATNKPIKEALASGAIRDDFYYRLAVVSFTLPTLRERPEDIGLLARSFIDQFAARMGKEGMQLDPVATDVIAAYPWPGNIRELENVIERAVIMADNVISTEHLGIHLRLDFASLEEATRTLPEIAAEAVRKAEMEAIRRALDLTEGNKSRASHILGVSYKTLLNKIKEYGLGSSEGSEQAAPAE